MSAINPALLVHDPLERIAADKPGRLEQSLDSDGRREIDWEK